MKNIAVLITQKALIAAIGNTRYMFNMVNNFLQQAGKPPVFNVKLVGITKDIQLDDGLYSIHVDATLDDATLDEEKQTDIIIIPPMSGNMESGIAANKEYIPWIKKQYKLGAEVASLCVGAFLLAETGLLKGEECSTHWQTADEFRKRFPDVQLVDYRIVTDHKGLYTSGGSNSYWNLLVYLVEKYVDHEMALRTSKYFEVEMNRNHQSQFLIFEGNKCHEDELIKEVQVYMENNYQQKITIDELSYSVNLTSKTFQRRFKKATHYTVLEYLQKVRVEVAKQRLESDRYTVNEAMFETGYLDSKAFRNVFKKNTGLTPLEYRQRFRVNF